MDESVVPALLDLHPSTGSFLHDVRAGLESDPRTLPCKYFYDAKGSHLFDRITELDEYYPARIEVAILESNLDDIVESLENDPLVIEFGSGNSSKTRLLLDHLPDAAGYVPVDISRDHLVDAAARLQERYPDLEILPVCADFTEPIPIPEPKHRPGHRVVFFPGSTIGNFTRDEAEHFLRTVAEDCGEGGGLLVGVDLKKDPQRLERAYDDREGVTAAFNLNLLDRINRELGTDFDVDAFRHRAIWNPERAVWRCTSNPCAIRKSISTGGPIASRRATRSTPRTRTSTTWASSRPWPAGRAWNWRRCGPTPKSSSACICTGSTAAAA